MAMQPSASPYAKRVAALDPATIERELDRLQRKILHYRTALERVADMRVREAQGYALGAIREADRL